MPKIIVESEYDMDKALSETVKLVKLKNCSLDVGFNNMGMVSIFLDNLKTLLTEEKIDPSEKDFKLNIMVKTSDEQA
jgi:hypothetical protein